MSPTITRSPGALPRHCINKARELAFTYQGDAFQKRVAPLVDGLGGGLMLNCDASREDDLDAVFAALDKQWGKLDFLVHAIAYSNKEELKGRYVDTTLDNFLNTMHISCYSYTSIMRPCGASYGRTADRRLPCPITAPKRLCRIYNVMGVAKAALEASVRYLARRSGTAEYSRQCDLCRADANAGRLRDWQCASNFPLQCSDRAATPFGRIGRAWRYGRLFVIGFIVRRNR